MKKRIRKILTCLTITLCGYLLFATMNVSATTSNIHYVTSDGFELTKDFSSIEKFYSEFASITVDPSEVISGDQSLKIQTTSPAGTYTPVLLTSERDVIDMSGPNSYKLSMKLKTYSFQAIMIDIRKDWNSNTKESMPYEFGLFINDSGETTTLSRRPGWIPLDQLLTYNEQYSVDENGVISISFEFISQEPVIFEMKGQIGDIDNGYIIVDDFLLEKQPRMIETFENITGNFWECTPFWANSGSLTSNENEAIDGTSLNYTFTDNDAQFNVNLGGITANEFSTALGQNHTINFDIKGLSNANGFTLVLNGGGDYKEFNLNLLDGSFTGNFDSPVVTTTGDYYQVALPFTANVAENYEFTFYGGGDLGVATGIVIDNFNFTVDETNTHVTPQINSTYNKAVAEDLKYDVDFMATDFKELRNASDEVIDAANYMIEDHVLTLKSSYLDTLEVSTYTYKIVTNFSEKEFVFNVVDTRPILICETNDYEQSLLQPVSIIVDVKGFDFENITNNLYELTNNDFTFVNSTLELKSSYLKTLTLGENTFIVHTTGGQASFSINVVEGRLPIEDNSKTFDKGLSESLSFTLNIPTNTINGVELNNQSIDQYTVENNMLTINKTYLQTLAVGTYEFTIKSTNGDFTFTIEIVAEEPIINGETTKDFDKADAKDISYTFDLKGLDILSLNINGSVLNVDDYSYADNTLVISKEILRNLQIGEVSLTLKTEGGEVAFSINVTESKPPIEDSSKTFDKGLSEDVSYTLNIPMSSINTIELNNEVIDQYTIENNLLTINKTYLQTLSAGIYEFTVKTTSGDLSFTIEVVVGAPVISGETTKEFDQADAKDIEFTIDLKGLDIISLSIDGNDLETDNYSYADNTLVIKKEFLQSLQTGDVSLTLKTEGGEVYLNATVVNNENSSDETDSNNFVYYFIPVGVLVITGLGIVITKKFRK